MTSARTAACVGFLQRLIQTPSLPGREGAVAKAVADEMQGLGFDDVRVDEAGSVIGLVRGRGEAPAVMFNTHLDHVDVGDPKRWPHPPYGGVVSDGRVWGRGAVDIKGPLAAQLHGVGSLLADGVRPPGDVYVTAVVQEEVGGFGAQYLSVHLEPLLVVVGEPSRNELRRGHRGRTELVVRVRGRSVHASVPEQGRNPLDVMAEVIKRLKDIPMKHDPDLGSATVAPTMIRTDQTSANVVPGEARLTCDWRTVPGQSGEEAQRILLEIAKSARIDGTDVDVSVPAAHASTYTGLTKDWPTSHLAFLLPKDHAALAAAARILQEAIGLTGPPGVWRFATDGGHFAAAGCTVIGFGPGDDGLAHTVHEAIEIAAIDTAMTANRAIALEWGPACARASIKPGGS
jgi:putative selenium metabolism hydrolase